MLKRLADEVRYHVNNEVFVTATGTEALEEYELEFARAIDLTALDDALRPFLGKDLHPGDDAAMAIVTRAALPLSPREAADRNLWWWLCLRRYPTIVQRRWVGIGEASSAMTSARMFGQVNRNAFARLWWGAELTKDLPRPDHYTSLLFKNQDLFEAVIGRSLGRYPLALAVILDELAGLKGKDAREIVRDFRFLLSTLVLEAMSTNEVRAELSVLVAARR